MDLNKIGKFIAELRKQKGLTQVKLAERLNVSEKTISKWECGNGFPDTSLIIPLCEVLEISANELLTGKRLNGEEYKNLAEENILLLKSEQEKATKHLLLLEIVVGFMSTLSFMFMIFSASFFVENLAWRIAIIIVACLFFLVGLIFTIRIETLAGYYECGNCHYKYIPKYRSVIFSMHYGRTRYMKCPKCGKHSWNKKTIRKD